MTCADTAWHEHRVWRALRSTAAAFLVLLAAGGIPGPSGGGGAIAPAPGVPGDAKDRDCALDVAVRSVDAGPPITGAHVRAFAILGDHAYLADAGDTDGAGRAHLSRLPRGDTWIVVDAPDRARGSSQVAVDASAREITVELEPAHAFDVLVKDERGEVVAEAEIEVVAPGEPLPVGARTRSDGRARVGRLRAGPWRVAARAPGYEEATGRVNHDGEMLALTLRKLGGLLIHVVGPDDRPAAGAMVSVAGSTLWPPRKASTDDGGDLRMGSLYAGSYALRATKADAVSVIDFDVALGRGDEKRVLLRLERGRFVGVRILDGAAPDASGIVAARVSLAEGGLSPFPLEATSDAAGRARLGPIAAGTATLSARAEGFVPRGGVAVPEQASSDVRVILVRAGVLTGRVLDARGQPVGGATIEVAGTDMSGGPIFDDPRRARFQAAHFDAMLGGPTLMVPAGELGVIPGPVPPIPNGVGLSAAARLPSSGAGAALEADPWVTRGDGTFRASPASPGRVRAIVRHPQYVVGVSELVTIVPGGEAHVDVVMREGGVLQGRVLDVHDRPVEGARIDVSATRGTLERTTRTASDGSFGFVALPDSVTLTAAAADTDTPDARMVIAIPEGGRKEVTVVMPEPREPLPVTVVDERGQPLDAVQVTASSVSPDVLLRTTTFTDAHGDASLKRGRGVPLRVEVRAPSHAPRVVMADGSEESLRIELAPAESASGEVVSERAGDGIAAATVTLYTDLGVRRARTDGHGAFALSELAAGNAQISVRAPGFAPLTRTMAIPDSGGRRSFAIPRIGLATEGTLDGEVVDARGEPVAGARVARDAVPTWLPVGSNPPAMATTDAQGRFSLRELPEGTVTIEAYAPSVGRARIAGVRIVAGRPAEDVRIVITHGSDVEPTIDVAASGSVAVTLGETGAPAEVVIVSVVEGSEAERAGIAPGDVLLAVDGGRVVSMGEARARLSGSIAEDLVVTLRRGDHTLALRVAREPLHR